MRGGLLMNPNATLDDITIETSDPASPDFVPQVTVTRDDGIAFSLTLDIDSLQPVTSGGLKGTTSTTAILDGETVDTPPPVETAYYETQDDRFEKGTYEIETILNQPPPTNVLSFTLDTTTCDFWYQPPLTDAAIEAERNKDGNFYDYDGNIITKEEKALLCQPDWVIGSYAIYRKQISHQPADKVGHIPRPKAHDANNNEVWCDFNGDANETGILTVTVPQDFLDNAVYPVTVDPTFGNTNIQATSETLVNTIRGYRFTGAVGTGVSISIYATADGRESNAAIAVYLQSNVTKVTNSDGGFWPIGSSSHTQWFTNTYTSIPTFAAVDYIIAAVTSSDRTNNIRYDATGTANYSYTESYTPTTDTMPTTLSGYSQSNHYYSLYVTYNPPAGGNFFLMFP